MKTLCPYCKERPLGSRKNAKTCGDFVCRIERRRVVDRLRSQKTETKLLRKRRESKSEFKERRREIDRKRRKSLKYREWRKEYVKRPYVKERAKRWEQRPDIKKRRRLQARAPERRRKKREYQSSPEQKEKAKQRRLQPIYKIKDIKRNRMPARQKMLRVYQRRWFLASGMWEFKKFRKEYTQHLPRLLKLYYNQCNVCRSTKNLEIDHIISQRDCKTMGWSPEDTHHVTNLQILCQSCNILKGAGTMVDFFIKKYKNRKLGLDKAI